MNLRDAIEASHYGPLFAHPPAMQIAERLTVGSYHDLFEEMKSFMPSLEDMSKDWKEAFARKYALGSFLSFCFLQVSGFERMMIILAESVSLQLSHEIRDCVQFYRYPQNEETIGIVSHACHGPDL